MTYRAARLALLRMRITVSNRLCDLALWFEDRGRPTTASRVDRARHAIDRSMCRVAGHPRVIFGAMRDICLDCLTVVDEHPNGRGRAALEDPR